MLIGYLDDPSGGGYFYAMSIKKKIVSPPKLQIGQQDLQPKCVPS